MAVGQKENPRGPQVAGSVFPFNRVFKVPFSDPHPCFVAPRGLSSRALVGVFYFCFLEVVHGLSKDLLGASRAIWGGNFKLRIVTMKHSRQSVSPFFQKPTYPVDPQKT